MLERAKNYTEYPSDGLIEIRLHSPDGERIDYHITPKGLAWYTMLQCKLISQKDGGKFDLFWQIFIQTLKKCGYLKNY